MESGGRDVGDASGAVGTPRSRINSRPLEPGASELQKALADVADALTNRRLVILLGSSEIVARYHRSMLGQFWLTLSSALLVMVIGLVWANLWKIPVAEFLPYLALGHVLWTFVTGTLVDAASVFGNAAVYMRELGIARSTYMFANVVKHLVVLGHNSLVVLMVFVVLGIRPGTEALLFLPALVLTVATLTAVSFWLAPLGLRFRDVSNIVTSLVMVMFFLTPVIWRIDWISADLRAYLDLNPFHVYLELLRAPLLGGSPQPRYWAFAVAFLSINAAVGLWAFTRYRRSITYWL